jgi:hypothetical protein
MYIEEEFVCSKCNELQLKLRVRREVFAYS